MKRLSYAAAALLVAGSVVATALAIRAEQKADDERFARQRADQRLEAEEKERELLDAWPVLAPLVQADRPYVER